MELKVVSENKWMIWQKTVLSISNNNNNPTDLIMVILPGLHYAFQ